MKLLRYEDPETLIHTYGLANNKFFRNKDSKYIFVVKENATSTDLLYKKHDIEYLGMQFDRVVM
ncbi:hypothetical protein [Lactobacillus crispatus]|uniref:hypothetical protein n=1 Tax=Lactobacillus crispatus TaxID=47770 RepID=UPI0021A73605|nr:hypothetical protein [Lactobacillus crispatus]MCT3539963.1 hypothetical protein [Lactobacillus crispatus]